MLDISLVRTEPEKVREGLRAKRADPQLVDSFLARDAEWRLLTKTVDALRAKQKQLGAAKDIAGATAVKEEIRMKEETLAQVASERDAFLASMPNLPLPSVPLGGGSIENVVVREMGEKPAFDFAPKDYLTLAESLDLIDIHRAAKVSGSRFGYLKNGAALLEFALVQFALSRLVEKGFTPIVPPVLVKEEMMKGMGFADRDEDREESYFFEKDGLYLVGTSEQSVGPMYADEIFEERDLPKRMASFSTCFRREAGSYGKDTKGILRVHQFDKLELLSVVPATHSEDEHSLFLEIEELLMQELALPYRVVRLCTGDLSRPSASTYDIEAWMPGQQEGKGEYRETHSTSNTTDFQSRRLKIRYKDAHGAIHFAHLVNGTAFAIGRTLIAIFENYQTEKGTIRVPKVLQKWVGVKEIE